MYYIQTPDNNEIKQIAKLCQLLYNNFLHAIIKYKTINSIVYYKKVRSIRV